MLLLGKYIFYIIQSFVSGDYNNRISCFYGILSGGQNKLPPSDNVAQKQIAFQLQIGKRDIENLGILFYKEFQRLHLIVYQLVYRFHRTSHGILHTADILDNVLCRKVLGADNASYIKIIYNTAVIDLVYLVITLALDTFPT